MVRFLKKFPKVKKIVYYGTRRRTEYVRFSFSRSSSVPTPVHSSGVRSTATEFESFPSSSASSLQASHDDAANAVGMHQKFPYKKVAAGQIRIEGLPEDVLPLQLPSHYGERRLKTFLKCQEIKVQNMDTAVHTEIEYPGMIQYPTNSLVLTEFQNTAVSHRVLPALNISSTTHNFIQSAPIEISPVSHTNLPVLNNISLTTHNFIQSAPIEISPVSHTISPPVQTTSQFTSTAPEAIRESTSTQGICIETTKRLTDNQVEQTESHSQWIKSTTNPGPPDVCLKRKLEHTNLEVYSVKAIHAQRKIRGIQQYLVEWEGYTMKEATWEPKRNIPEEIINSLWKNIT